jgi:hypothetical protein
MRFSSPAFWWLFTFVTHWEAESLHTQLELA